MSGLEVKDEGACPLMGAAGPAFLGDMSSLKPELVPESWTEYSVPTSGEQFLCMDVVRCPSISARPL